MTGVSAIYSVRFLAQGGMGIIYLADDKESNNAPCVIKQLIIRAASKYDHDESVRLFKREAEVLKFLNHPGIVRLIDSHAAEDGHYFLVMDLVPGKSLDEICEKGSFFVPGYRRDCYSVLRSSGISS